MTTVKFSPQAKSIILISSKKGIIVGMLLFFPSPRPKHPQVPFPLEYNFQKESYKIKWSFPAVTLVIGISSVI